MDLEAKKLVDEGYEKAKALLLERRNELMLLKDKLLEKESLDLRDILAVLGERPVGNS